MREKLQETRIDAQSSSDPVAGSDLPMNDAPNGNGAVTAQSGDQSPSGSESERGRLRRKRSREDFEDDQEEAEKHPDKKERHARKKSRDVTSPHPSDVDALKKSAKTSVPPIHENDGDEAMLTVDEPRKVQNSTSKNPVASEIGASGKESGAVTSPKNKRTRDQADKADLDLTAKNSKDTSAAITLEEERTSKRPRDKDDPQPPSGAVEGTVKIPPSSGFANTSVASPFAALSPPPPTSKVTGKPSDEIPQTSNDKFKSSGFSTFSSSSASPFGGLGNTTSKSPFAAATGGSKITSFASSTSTSTFTGSGFGALGSSSGQSAFGGASIAPVGGKSVFGGTLGSSTFGALGGAKLGLPSFATPGQTAITGLSQKPPQSFGTQQKDAESDDETGSGGEEESTTDGNEEQESRSGWKPQDVETGEEGETTKWVGRAKLYTMRGEGTDKRWQERGVGAFKFNVTEDEPKKARFVLRADGTHRLILNAAVPKTMKFGDPQGGKPGDGKLCFNSPTADGKVEMYLLKLRAERAVDLYNEVRDIQDTML